MIPRKAYVEDVPDVSEGGAVAVVDVPPRAPSPPPAPMPLGAIDTHNIAPAAVNVFDFLVDEKSSPAKDALPASQLLPVARDAPTPHMRQQPYEPYEPYHFRDSRRNSEYDPHYMEQGFSYGASPIAHEPGIKRFDSSLNLALEPANYTTPAPGRGSVSMQDARAYFEDSTGRRKSTNKRKRNNVEELNLARHGPLEYMEGDQVMTDAPPLLHSGLTGGLNRLLTKPDFPPSPDYSGGDGDNGEPTPLAPLKRSKHSKSSTRSAADRDRDRGEHKPERRIVKVIKESARKSSSESQHSSSQSQSHTLGGEHTVIRHSRRRHKRQSAEPGEHRERRERHRSRKDREGSEQHQHRERQSRRRRRRHSSSSPHRSTNNRTLKAIEYHNHGGRSSRSPSNSQNGLNGGNAENQQLILRKTAITASAQANVNSRPALDAASFAELFLSFVTKGPESEKGCSVNKALKRFHRELGAGAAAGLGAMGGAGEALDGAGDGTGGGGGGGGGSSTARKAEEEKELFRALRLKKNDRGEIVVFM